MPAARIRRLTLTSFRSYRAAQIEIASSPAVLVGSNGAGKTNLIEAISFLAPGRGLRRATLDEVAFAEGDGSWAVSAEIEGALGLATLGTGIEASGRQDGAPSRLCRIDREPAASLADLSEHLQVIWLVPAMDQLFNGPASERRRFLDRLTLAIDPQHSARVAALERALRSRNRLLQEPRPDPHWLDAIERETAEIAVAVAAQRAAAVAQLRAVIEARRDPASIFPAAGLALDGAIENLLSQQPAIAVEDRYRASLAENRARDAAAGRTLEGPHLTDLAVIHAGKAIPAADASTGEQKALLIGLILAQASLIADRSGFAPVLLLDEVVAHLDPARRSALYAELDRLGAQAWLTGADPAAFAEIEGSAEVFEVSPGRVVPTRSLALRRPRESGDP
jgi:DNA replication and repair protein RecF